MAYSDATPAGHAAAHRAARVLAAAERYRRAYAAVKDARAVFDRVHRTPPDESRSDARRAYYAADDERDAACEALLRAARGAT